MPSIISYSAIALLAMQAMAGPAHPPHGHRRHHARHGKRACRAKAPHAVGQKYAYAGVAANGSVPIYISESAISMGSASAPASQIGNEHAATGVTSAVSAVPTTSSIDPNAVDPVSGFIASSASSTSSDTGGIIDTSASLGSSTTALPASASATSLSLTLSSTSSSLNVSSASSVVIASSASSVVIAPSASSPALPPVTGAGDKRVFAHFMVGIVSTYAQADWENDMKIAKAHGIDGFACNIGKDDYSQTQLDLAYAAAEVVDFDLFISFDFNWYHIDEVDAVATMFKRYMDKPKQYKVDGKPFVSTFIGDGFDWGAVEKAVGKPIHSVPFYEPKAENADLPSVSGLFSWSAWPGQLDNKPIKQDMTDERDLLYMSLTDPIQKDYMAPVSPWFFTHFGKEVSYSKNWLFYSETLWYDRWEQILKLQDSLKYLEIVTWNDYGESHYIGPVDTPHSDDGSSRYTKGLDHAAHLEFAVPYIKAFKAGSPTPIIEQDMLVYWYRPHLKAASCDSTDNCGSKPDGWDMVADEVFVATMTKNGGSFSATSGGNAAVTHEAGPGVQVFRVPMGVGEQSFTFTAAGQSGNDVSTVPISSECWNGVYNFNYHSGLIKL